MADQVERNQAGRDPGEAVRQEDAVNRERLARARLAFEAGDYRLVRELTRAVEQSGDREATEAARELGRRVEADPVMAAVLLACAVLFFVIAYVYVLR